jgi:hypothetical protein
MNARPRVGSESLLHVSASTDRTPDAGATKQEEIAMNTKLSMIALAVLFTLAGYEAASALNPQPLPPRHMPYTHASGPHRLNPQPLPPG